MLANAELVSETVANADPATDPPAKETGSVNAITQPSTAPSTASQDGIDGLSIIREGLSERGLSQDTQNIILLSWRGGTKKQYDGYIKKWQVFCSEWGTDPVHATVETVLEFLTELYKSGIGYSAINTARSALSAIVNLPDKSPVGQHPLVRRFLKGVFQSRPTTPRYNTTWDVNIVLDYLKSLFPVNGITLKNLTLKVVMLTILVTGQRSQTIHLMDIKNMQVLQDRYIYRK